MLVEKNVNTGLYFVPGHVFRWQNNGVFYRDKNKSPHLRK